MLIAIAGDSGIGKTTFAKLLYYVFYPSSTILHLDDYHKYSRKERELLKITPLNPKCNDLKLLKKHLKLIKEGKKFIKNVYDHSKGIIIKNAEIFKPKKINIIEGLFPYVDEELSKLYDLKIFIDVEEEIKLYWKILRDLEERGYVSFKDLKERLYDYYEYIFPQIKFADIIIRVKSKEEEKYKTEIIFQNDFHIENFDLFLFFKDLEIKIKKGKIEFYGKIEKEEIVEIINRYYVDRIQNEIKNIIKHYNTYTLAQLLLTQLIFKLIKKKLV